MGVLKNQSGLSIIEVLLILVVVGILGFTGWYVYHAKQASDKNYSAAANQALPMTSVDAETIALKVANATLLKTYAETNARLTILHQEGYITNSLMADQPIGPSTPSNPPADYIYACTMFLDYKSFAVGKSTVFGANAVIQLQAPANSENNKYSQTRYAPKVTLVFQNGKWAASDWTCASY